MTKDSIIKWIFGRKKLSVVSIVILILMVSCTTTTLHSESKAIQSSSSKQVNSASLTSSHTDQISSSVVGLSGSYTRIAKINGYDGNLAKFTSAGEVDGKLLLFTPDTGTNEFTVMLFNPTTFTAEKVITFSTQTPDSFYGLKLFSDKIVVRLSDKLIVFSRDLNQRNDSPLPNTIINKIKRIPVTDKNGMPNVRFGGYDVTQDLKKIVYSDEVGIKLLDTTNSQETLLAKTNVSPLSYHNNPRFVCDETKVITTMTGDDDSIGYTLCDIIKKTSVLLKFGDGSTDDIHYDSGILSINTRIINSQGNDEYKSYYTDFKTGQPIEINLANKGSTGIIRPSEYTYVGKSYAAFINSDNNRADNNVYQLSRLNLKTLEVENDVIVSKAGELKILGVTDDGQIIFSCHNYNLSSTVYCITGKPSK